MMLTLPLMVSVWFIIRILFARGHARVLVHKLLGSVRLLYIDYIFTDLKDILGLAQIMAGLLPAFDIAWPSHALRMVAWMKRLLSLDLPLQCAVHMDYIDWLRVQTTLPVVFFCILLLFNETTAFLFVFLFYPMTVSSIFGTFDCVDFDDGTKYLRRDYSVDCNTSRYFKYRAYAEVMACCVGAGVPLLYVHVLRSNRGRLNAVQRVQTHLNVKAGRSKALEIFEAHHRHLGIELDPNQRVAAVKNVWPVYVLHEHLTEAEEEAAFAHFQRKEGQHLQAIADMRLELDGAIDDMREQLSTATATLGMDSTGSR